MFFIKGDMRFKKDNFEGRVKVFKMPFFRPPVKNQVWIQFPQYVSGIKTPAWNCCGLLISSHRMKFTSFVLKQRVLSLPECFSVSSKLLEGAFRVYFTRKYHGKTFLH